MLAQACKKGVRKAKVLTITLVWPSPKHMLLVQVDPFPVQNTIKKGQELLAKLGFVFLHPLQYLDWINVHRYCAFCAYFKPTLITSQPILLCHNDDENDFPPQVTIWEFFQ